MVDFTSNTPSPSSRKAVGECGGCWFVDDSLYGEACDFAGFLGCLTLGVVEVGGNGDYGFGD